MSTQPTPRSGSATRVGQHAIPHVYIQQLVATSLPLINTAIDLTTVLCLAQTESDFTVEDVARCAGISPETVRRVLSGIRLPLTRKSFLTTVIALGTTDTRPWEEAWKRASRRRARIQQVSVTGDNTNSSTSTVGSQTPAFADPQQDLAEQQREFFLDFLHQALTQSDRTFRYSVFFTSIGTVIVLASAVLAMFNLEVMSIASTVTGAMVTTGAGAFTVQASRSRKHLTAQAAALRDNVWTDHALKQALTIIEQFEDIALRDHYKSLIVSRILGIDPATRHPHLSQQLEPSHEPESN